MSNAIISCRPGSEKNHREGAGKNIAGLSLRALLQVNSSITPGLFGRWGLFGDGVKRVDWDKAYLTVTLYRKGQSFDIIKDMSVMDVICLSNFANSTYELGRYSDNGTFPTGSADTLQQYFSFEFPTGAICLTGSDELHVKIRIEDAFACLNNAGNTTAVPTVLIGGSSVPYRLPQTTGLPFINKDTSRVEVSFIEDSKFAIETSLPIYKSVNIEVGASNFPVTLGDNIVRCDFVDYAFGRLPVDASTNENVVSLVSASIRSEQLTLDTPVAALWANTTQAFQNWDELMPRRGHIVLLGDPTVDKPTNLIDYDATSISLSLRPTLVKDQKQRVLSLAYYTSIEQKELAAFKVKQQMQRNASKVS